ncbi:MAG TPA: hydrogenase/urease maturation nickel metallochaperone HypA [Chloroflexota bacterium]|nr:hydrogenase/urease maturation nickel metallochaperone HypA [Chloroflexota bacterium]
MHEVSLVSAAIAAAVAAAQRAGAQRVERLTFALAPTGHVTREAVETLVAALAAGTLVEGAAVDFEPQPNAHGGPELVLASIDVEVL